ncbi:MAG TPA: gamma-glutamylcyclotransferase [Daejeonella sp.]|nr:gamma-glutamylcyclotransferase [Daejeonella sp.]
MEISSYFYYFAYASNLKVSVLEQRINGKVQDYIQGRLIDYGFRFNRKNSDGTARANIIFSESEDVFGVLYQVDEKYRNILLQTEPGYSLIEVPVETDQGNVQAFTFISDADDEDIYPGKDYLSTILSGAKEHALPAEYTDFVKSLAK